MTDVRDTAPNAQHELSLLRLSEVRQRIGLSRSTIYARIAEGKFPRPVPIGARAVGFLTSEVDGWIAAQVERRDRRDVAGADK